ncbi:hypothetical protein E3T55_10300 [Cryobacterium frigoriphilum]|uniref:Uncharacterized protein n=1 Tax=Cryobacterium frigoriphilum TaxID=1259150 RepID=A0A4R9A1D0_9MICO|nr:hypothetical protein [Cryobacterium frigoriphilum]TFD50284.1 hypothetical protein E3T55_10300 [Cryobacterium frigoriphilum]
MHDQRPALNLLSVLGLQLSMPLAVAAIALSGKWILGLWTTESTSYWGLALGAVAFVYWVPLVEKKVRALNRERSAMRRSQKAATASPAN